MSNSCLLVLAEEEKGLLKLLKLLLVMVLVVVGMEGRVSWEVDASA